MGRRRAKPGGALPPHNNWSMMAIHSRLFDYDELTGIKRIWHWDDVTETATIETKQPLDDLFDYTKHLFNQNKKHTRYGEMERMASIPLALYFDLKKKGILDDQKAMKKWLNDSDNRVFRTRPGVV